MTRPSGQPDEFAAAADLGHVPHLRWGQVVKNDDPDRLGRCILSVPGLLKETAWAWPIGMLGSGYPGRGGFTVPKKGATVLVGFIQGDTDEPFYMAGPPRKKDGAAAPPTQVQQVADRADVHNTHVILETENFEVFITDSNSAQRLVLQKKGGDGEALAINLFDKSVRISAGDTLMLEAGGVIDLDAPQVQIKKRVVSPTGTDI